MTPSAINALPVRIACDRVEPAQRVEYWREMISSSLVSLDCEVPRSDDFSGSVSNGELRDVQVSRVVADAQRVARTPARIRQSPEDFFLLSFQLRGYGRVVQGERDALLAPGDFALYDSARPYRLLFDQPFEQIVLRLPRALVGRRMARPERVTAIPFRSGRASANLAFGFVAGLANELPSLAPATQAVFHQALVDILVGTLAEPFEGQQDGDSGHGLNSRHALRQRIRQFVEDHLAQPDLDCRRIADAHGISSRYLSKLFAEEDLHLSEWLWTRRLDRARAAIEASASTGLSITRIAYEWGFKDPAHFSRAFKARFGRSPSELRSGSL